MPFVTKFWSLSWLDAPRWWEKSPVSVGSSHHPRASCCLCGGLSALPQFPWIKKLTVFAVKFTSALLQDVPALELFHSASDSSWPCLNVNRNLKVNKITVLYLVHIYNRFYGCCVQLITLSTLSPEYRSDRSTFERALCFMLYSFNILVSAAVSLTYSHSPPLCLQFSHAITFFISWKCYHRGVTTIGDQVCLGQHQVCPGAIWLCLYCTQWKLLTASQRSCSVVPPLQNPPHKPNIHT